MNLFKKYVFLFVILSLSLFFGLFNFCQAQATNSYVRPPLDENAKTWLRQNNISDDNGNVEIYQILKNRAKLADNQIIQEFKDIYGNNLNRNNTRTVDLPNSLINGEPLKTTHGIWSRKGGALGFQSSTVNNGNPVSSDPRVDPVVKNANFTPRESFNLNHATLPEVQFEYHNPLQVNSFTGLISHFLAGLQAIIGWLAVIMIVIGGIVYITSAGKSSQLELGKKILTFALLGFAIAVAAPSILKEIMVLAGNGQGTSNGGSVIAQATDVRVILMRVLNFVITLIGIIATIGFVISGFNFIAAGGDSGRAEKARKGLMYSIIGVVVAGTALIVIRQVLILLGMQV